MAAEGVLALWLRAVLVLLLLYPLAPLTLAAVACPRSCSCPGPKEVHCTFRHLTSVPRNLPKDTERFNLGYNSLQAVEGSEFTHLRQLEMLMLHGNDIMSVSPGAFYSLRSLQILKLSYNKLKTISPGMFEGLVGLVRLHLDHNIIDFIEPYTFNGLTSLKLLQLEGNRLRDLHPHSFVTLSLLGNFWSSGLRHLHLSDNQLTYLLPAALQTLSRLEVLSLHGNPWTCDCQLHWLVEWNNKHEGVIKCKKERVSGSSENCAMCASPQPLNGSQVLGLPGDKMPCERPLLQSSLKQWDSPGWEDAEPDLPYTRDLERPLGHLTFVLTDSHGNKAHVACDVRRPSESTAVTWENLRTPGEVLVNVTLVSLLECEIDRDALQNLWRLVAYYYESPAIMERGERRGNSTKATFQYSQAENEDSPYFTDLKGHLTAEPPWLLQPKVTLQLNRRQTTTKKLVLDFTALISKHIRGRGEADDFTSSWALIKRGTPDRVQSVLEGSEVTLECNVISSGPQSVEWMLPDLSILEDSNTRLVVSESGLLVIGNASLSDSGVYHCLVRTEVDVDLVPVRLTVKEHLLSPNALNGKKMSVESGGSLSLPCSVTSAQPSETRWYLPQNQILLPSQPKERVYVSENGTLVIKKTTHEDAGEYSCLAANIYGVDMLSHLVVVTGERNADKADVQTDNGESLLLGSEEEEGEGSGFQEIKRPQATQSPKRVGEQQRKPGGFLRPGIKGKRIKDNKRKPNKSVKELDPTRWAEILAKANAKAPTALPTKPPLTMPITKTATTMTAKTTVNTPTPPPTATPVPTTTTTLTTTTTTTKTTTVPPATAPEITTSAATKPTRSFSKTTTFTAIRGETDSEKQDKPLRPPSSKDLTQDAGRGGGVSNTNSVTIPSVTQILTTVTQQPGERHVGERRVNAKNNPVWTNRRRPPYRRGRPPARRVRPLKPSLPSSHKPQTTPPQPTTTVEKYESSPSSNDKKMLDNVRDVATVSTHDHSEEQKPVNPIREPNPLTDKPDGIPTEFTTTAVNKDPSVFSFSTRQQHVPASKIIPTPDAENMPYPTEMFREDRTRESSNKQDAIRQTSQNRQTSKQQTKIAAPKPTPNANYDINIKPPLSQGAVTMATPVLIKLDESKKGIIQQPETSLIHIQNPPPKKTQDDKMQTLLRTPIVKGSHAQEDILRKSDTDKDKKEDSSKMKPESPNVPQSLPIHPWLHQQHIQRRVHTTLPPQPPTSYWPANRFPVWPPVHGSRPYPASTDRSWHFPHPGGRGAGVTNRPEITAQTVKPTAFISGSPGVASAQLTSQPAYDASAGRARDLLLLTKLRSRYRQAQLDRIAQLGKRVTPKPRISHPTPRPHQPPAVAYPPRPAPTTALPIPTGRPYSTARVLYGSRWHYDHWGNRRMSTALPFPKLMGTGVKPRITTVNTVSVSALAESDVLMPCVSSGDPQPSISWTKVSTGATIQANTKHGPRFEVLMNGTFVIKNVQLQDRGQYLCTAQNKFGSDRMVTTLAVLTQPPKIRAPHSKEVPVYLGKPISLDCVASGKPPAQISWILPDRTFVRDMGSLDRAALLLPNGTLRIQSANFSSKGDYKCIASNAAGADTVTYHIHVAALPPTIHEEASESVSIQAGRSVYVHCSAKGQPAPILKWTLPAGVHVKPSQFLGRRLFVFPNGTLYIRNISPADSGRYECSATNPVGVAKRVLHLDARQEAPSLPRQHPSQQHRVTAMYGSRVYLHCPESTGSSRGTVWQLPSKTLLEHRYSPERPFTVFPNGTLRILQLTEKDGGSYLCMFQRPNGEDMELFQVEVLMTPPKIEHLGTAQKRVTYGENFQVDCVASGLPDPEVSWSLPDGTMINNALQSDDSGTRSRRYIIFGNGTLLLQQMGKRDEGDYTCYAKNKLGADEMKVSVKVGPESPRIMSKAQWLLTPRLGDSAFMKCQATGEPPPIIVWLSPGNDILASSAKYQILDDGTLVIKRVTLSDQGKYACLARNTAGDDIKNMMLEVESREPHINGQGGRNSVKVLAVSYQTTLLDCQTEGKPEPLITWTTPYGLLLPTPYLGGRFQVHKNGSLELRGLRKTDEGQFVCLAKNPLGEASLAIKLEVASLAEKPSFAMPNIEILPIKQDGSDVTLECPARGKPNPEFVWLLPNGTALTPGTRFHRFTHYPGNGTLRIGQPVTADKGIYRCLAKNVAGHAEKRYALEPGRKPLIRGTTGVMKSTYGQSLNLPCSVDGWPQATIAWTLPNGLVLDKPQVMGRVTYLPNGTLQLREVATFDRGTYVCKATNTFGSSTLSYPIVVMVYPPRITKAPASITRVNRGSPVRLDCIAAGIPKPDISWTLPGRTTLVPHNRFTVQGGIHMTVEGSLVILDPVLTNSGIYKCNAKNALGTDFKPTYLQVT